MSDHFSGPRAMAGPFCDITDAYAFPSPERPGKLVLAMNVLPRATIGAVFSDAVLCRFRLRPLTVVGSGIGVSFQPGEKEFVFDWVFDQPTATGKQTGPVATPFGETFSFKVHDANGTEENGVRVFAGIRSDPFFVDFTAGQHLLKTGELAFTDPGVLTGPGANVLCVLIELDAAPFIAAAGGSLFAFVAETVANGKLPIRLERFGRPEIKNMVLSVKHQDRVNRDLEVRDLYNLEDAFHIGPDYRNAYRARFNANLGFLDRADGKIDWPTDSEGVHPLTELLLNDFTVIDIAKPYADGSFFEIEQSLLAGRPYTTSGGRPLNDNIIDIFFSLVITGGKGEPVSQHVDQATQPASSTFPFLAAPNAGGQVADPHAHDHDDAGAHDDHFHHKFDSHGN